MGLTIALCGFSLLLGSCGGGQRQDVNEPSGKFPISIVKADFPTFQRLAQTSELKLAVRNEADQLIPDLAITINTRRADETASSGGGTTSTPGQAQSIAGGPFSVISQQPGLAIPSRPVWVLEEGYPKLAGGTAPAGAEAAQTNTYAFGELPAGSTRSMIWKVTAVQAGDFTVSYRVAAGLQGKAIAVNTDGSVPEGEFAVRITQRPAQTRVNEAGKVVPIKRSELIGKAGAKKQNQEAKK